MIGQIAKLKATGDVSLTKAGPGKAKVANRAESGQPQIEWVSVTNRYFAAILKWKDVRYVKSVEVQPLVDSSTLSEISGETSTAAKLVWRLPSALKGLMRTSLCMPVSPLR